MSFARPDNLEDALSLLASGKWSILSGGTDFYPSLRDRPVTGRVLDISALPDLRQITDEGAYWRIGALATWSDLCNARLPPAFDGLKLAAREIGSVQIQNRASVVGNVCNASPAADGVPPLLTLDAVVRLTSIGASRDVPLEDFIVGNRKTVLKRDELVTALLVPKASAVGRSTFLKLGGRKYLIISISMVAVRLACGENGRIDDAAVSVGACSEVALRLPALEAALTGRHCSDQLAGQVVPSHLDQLSPIDDVRATARYRIEASVELVRRAVALAGKETGR